MDAATVIARYNPPSLAPEVAAFARELVAAAAPLDAKRAESLLYAAGKLGTFAASVGLELSAEVCLSPGVVERFAAVVDLSATTRRTARANLRFLRRQVLPHLPPEPLPLSRERAKRPYSATELAEFLALCDAQPTKLRRSRLTALVCLGAGAGLVGADLRRVTGPDVVARSGGVVVEVRAGRHPRVVPVLPPFGDRLLAVARVMGDRYLIGGSDPDRKNVTSGLVERVTGGADLGAIDTGRLRATFLAQAATAIGLRGFMDAAGIICSQRLGDLVAGLPRIGEAELVALLGGAR